MTDEQIAREFLEQVALLRMDGMAIFTLTGIIRRVCTTERARCAAIVKQHIGYDECGRAAADIYDAIAQG